ncbi:MAG: signal recognition particle protein Srp54 [Promethearchaeota archaeon]
MVLEKLGRALDSAVRKLRGLPRVDKEAINAFIQELQRALLAADVKVELVFQFTEAIRKRAMDEWVGSGITRKDFIIKILHDELVKLLGGGGPRSRIKVGRENIVLLVGIQGSGKTTTVAKLAKFYKEKRNMRVGVVCTDTWRPGAYEQLQQLCEPINVEVFGDPSVKNAVKLGERGVRYFFEQKGKKKKADLVIVDTAGRHKEEKELMSEMSKLESRLKPNEVILVVDGTIGQQAFNQAREFAATTHVGSIIVTKLDGSAKGGGALSAVAATGAPITFIGVGERQDDLEPFKPTSFVGSLLGIPQLEELIEKVKEAQAIPEKDVQKRFMKGKFTLEDLYNQLKALRKMGPFRKILSMLGGQNIPEELKGVAEEQLDKWRVVLDSMTAEEKEKPQILKKSRIQRVAIGSGTSYSEVRELLKQYDMMKKMMKRFVRGARGSRKGKRGGMPGLPGFPGFPAMGGLPGGQKKKP